MSEVAGLKHEGSLLQSKACGTFGIVKLSRAQARFCVLLGRRDAVVESSWISCQQIFRSMRHLLSCLIMTCVKARLGDVRNMTRRYEKQSGEGSTHHAGHFYW